MANQSKELPPWGSAIAGSTGAVLANALVYPLDIVKTKLQVQVKKKKAPDSTPTPTSSTFLPPPETTNETNGALVAPPSTPAVSDHHEHYHGTIDAVQKIVKLEGLSGLYAGMTGSLLGVASTNFAYFYWYTTVRSVYLSYQAIGAKPPGTAVELGLGAVAGALAQLFTIPVAVVTTRQQTVPKHERKGLIATGREVVESEDGWSGLWRGLKASLVLVVNPAITYGSFQRLREVLFPNKVQLRPWEAFILGSLSKMIATIATQPLIVAKVGLQSRPPPARNGKPFKTFGEVMAYIVEHEGVLSLFKGIGPQILKGFLVQGLLMMVKERMELMFVVLFRYLRKVRQDQLRKLAEKTAEAARKATPVLIK